MGKIVLPIDTKSLFLNIYNDNITGHTATVSTPIKQRNAINQKLINIFEINSQLDFNSKPKLIDELIKNSKSKIKINNVFVFNNISVNGKLVDNNGIYYAIYIKEEIDPTKEQYGRIKLHYPINLKYEDEDINIDNKFIIKTISSVLHDYAFVVNSFDYNTDNNLLNFNVTIIGENNIPYSKVFINNKGAGNKYVSIFNEDAESYDMEIIALRNKFGQDVNPENYLGYMSLARDKAISITNEYLQSNLYQDISCISLLYPYSLYDFECKKDGKVKYFLFFYTASSTEYFNISSKKLKFISDFADDVNILIIANIFGKEIIKKYEVDEILSFSKSINSIMIRKE